MEPWLRLCNSSIKLLGTSAPKGGVASAKSIFAIELLLLGFDRFGQPIFDICNQLFIHGELRHVVSLYGPVGEGYHIF